MRNALLASLLYLCAAVLLAGCRPLWLDEILQLMDTRQPSAAELIARLPAHHTGSAPLGYLTQQSALKITGYSVRRARLTAAVFGAAALFVTILLAAELGLNAGWCGWIYAILPLTLRYSTEARMYSQALFFSVLATFVYVRLAKRPGWILAMVYALALTAAVYTQPYAVSVGLAHVLWSLWCREHRTALIGGGALAAALTAFLPWYLWARHAWTTGDGPYTPHFSASWKVPLVLFREVAGAGYWGSALLLFLCILALARNSLPRRTNALLVLLIATPLAGGLAADALFNYFLAARQFLWILPPVAMLATSAGWRMRSGRVLLALLAGACIWQNARFFSTAREDWQAASEAIVARTRNGACFAAAPQTQARLYEFFEPRLRASPCDGRRLILALTPYSTRRHWIDAASTLRAQGFRRVSEDVIGGTAIIEFRREKTRGYSLTSR